MESSFILLRDHLSEDEGKRVTSWGNQIDEWSEMKGKWMIYKEIINPVSPSQIPPSFFSEKSKEGGILMKARIENFTPYHPELEEFLNHTLKPLLESKIGKKVNLFKDKMNWKYPKGHGFGAHQDHPAWTDFPPSIYWTVAIFADTATKENGCLEFGDPKTVLGENEILPYDKEGTGSLIDQDKFDWEYYPVTPRDVLIFNSFAPHRSGPNNTKGSRRIFYFTFNLAEEGDYYQDYVDRKREELPPDIEREKGKDYKILGSKYNLANPIV